jgi:hypothetical protein
MRIISLRFLHNHVLRASYRDPIIGIALAVRGLLIDLL